MTGTAAEIRSHVGWTGPERSYVVEAGQLARFAAAIGDPRWTDTAPPTFTATMIQEPPEFPPALAYGSGWLNAGDRFEYSRPLRAGDHVVARTRLADVFEKTGSSGGLLFLVFETGFVGQDGEVAVKHIGTRIRR